MIHIVTGPPCAGKSTYIREHAKSGDLRVDYDAIAVTLGAEKSHHAEGLVRKAAFDARDAAIKRALQNPDKEAWIIHTKMNADTLARYNAAGAEIITLDPGKDVCLERAAQDERPQNSIDAILEWYAEHKEAKKMRLVKEFSVHYKDEGNGYIEGYASTWIREPDSYGDVVKAGAFKRSLAERWNGGKGIPFIWAHKMDDINAYIGTADAEEDDKGLFFRAYFNDSPEAQKVRGLYKSGALKKFSFAYDVLDAGEVKLEDGRKANELRELDLYEISAVLVPANDDAGVVDVKSGRRNSAADADAIRQAITLLEGILGEVDEQVDEPKGEEPDAANAKAEEPAEVVNPKKDRLLEYIKNISNN